MKFSSCLLCVTIIISWAEAAYSQSVRSEQVIRLENANNHAASLSLSASPWSSTETKVVFPSGTPQVGQILRVDSISGGVIKMAWTPDRTNSSMARVYFSGTDTLPAGSWQKVEFNAESFDLNDEYDNSSNHSFVAKEAGYYHVTSRIELEESAYPYYSSRGIMTLAAYKNGSVCINGTMFPMTISTTSNNLLRSAVGGVLSDIVYLNANDKIEIYLYYSAMTNYPRGLVSGESKTFLSVYKVK